ncbi:MAG TPA: type VI secretion system baseplate subunit TssG [Bryobacteraceae bacterium]|nr:type VI secretion system baseplate subunit TssG [Bryobacteraceae bacterium]
MALEKVRDLLFGDPCSFDFFQAVRILGWLQPAKSPVGRHSHPNNEVVRIGAHPILYFPASAIHELKEGQNSQPEMVVNFMGLIGPLGALPNYVTELIASRVRAHDRAMLAFLNIFNHRLTSFFYQAWEKNHFTVAYERDRSDPVTACLYAMVGFGTKGIRGRQPVVDEAFIYYCGLFGLIPKSALGLESVLADYFDAPVELEPFIGTWRGLDDPDCCEFGGDIVESTALGMGAVVGDEIWDQGSRMRIKLGPLTAARYREFLPTGSAWRELKAIVRSFCGYDLEFEVQLILKREDVPQFELRPQAGDSLYLGWLTWLKSANDFNRNPGDTILLLGD